MNWLLRIVSYVSMTFACLGYSVYALEYLYPVGYFVKPDQTYAVYVIYQKSLDHLEIFEWNPESGVAHKALLSTYTPAFFALLPDQSGFSFIDKGRIRIKHFFKRSPQTLALYEPVGPITGLEWIDAESCYFVARFAHHAGIFCTTLTGDVQPCCVWRGVDCMYPQHVQGQLFFVRHTHGSYAVCTLIDGACTELVNFLSTPIAFLTMIDSTHGYVIEHRPFISKHDLVAPFACWHVAHTPQGWEKSKLFDFYLPVDLFVGEGADRLYESIMPLLPRYTADYVYFSDYDAQEDAMMINAYSVTDGTTQLLAKALHHYVYAPLLLNNQIFYGGIVTASVTQETMNEQQPRMVLDDEYVLHLTLPSIPRTIT